MCGSGSVTKPEGSHADTSPQLCEEEHEPENVKDLRLCVECVMQYPISDVTGELNFQENERKILSLINAKLTL